MWLQLRLRTAADFWLLAKCLGMAKESTAPQNNDDYDAYMEDIDCLAHAAVHFEDHMRAGISSIAEMKGSALVAMLDAVLLAFVSGILFCGFIGMK